MLNCYFLAVCQLSSIDENSKSVTLVNMIESVGLAPFPPPGTSLQIELHAYFEAEEPDRDRPFETRLVWVSADGTTWHPGIPPNTITLPPTAQRLRVRAANIRIPPKPGTYQIHMEARRPGEDTWKQISSAWPLELADLSAEAPPQVNAALEPKGS